MKALIIYVSLHHQNTEKIARAIGKVLGAKLAKPFEIDLKEIRHYDLIGFGSGIYFGRYHKSLIDLAKNLPDLAGKKAFIFSTSGMRELPVFNRFNGSLRKILENQGLDIVGEFQCRGWDTFGPVKFIGGLNKGRPGEKDLQKAAAFTRKLLEAEF